MTVHKGSCHCGAVEFEVEGDFSGGFVCDCSLCKRKGAIMMRVPKEQFKLTKGADDLSSYQWNTKIAKHYFCKHCGIHPFIRPRLDPGRWAFNVRCIDGVDLSSIKVRAFDGQNWEETAKAYYDRVKK